MVGGLLAGWVQEIRRPQFWRDALPFACIALLVVLFASPLLARLHNTGTGDWDQHCFFDEVPRTEIVQYHQFPFWNPYESGGRPALGNPQYDFFRPTFLLTLAFGCVVGLKLDLIILYIVGIVGMFLLMRFFKVSALPALLSASMFGMTSYFALRLVEGHTTFWSLMFVPYVFLWFLKSLKTPWYVVPAGIAYGLTLLYGGVVYATVPLGMFMGVYALVLSIQQRTIQPFVRVATISILAVFLTAFFTIPVLYESYEHPRIVDTSNQFISLSGLIDALLSRNPFILAQYFPGQQGRWHEFTIYIGIIPLLLFLVGLVLFWRKELALIVAAFVMLLFGLGSIAPNAPWSLLHAIPLFQGFQVPYRFNIFFVFACAIIAGMAADYLLKRSRAKSFMHIALICLLVFSIADLAFVGYRMHSTAFPIPLPAITPEPEFRQLMDLQKNRSGAYSSMYYNLKSNRGTLNPFDPLPHGNFATGFNEKGYRGEVYLDGAGNASYVFWSPNRLVVNVGASNATLLIINQNYDQGWNILDGRETVNTRGLLSATVTPQDRELTFLYRTPYWLIGWIVFLATCVALVVLKKHH